MRSLPNKFFGLLSKIPEPLKAYLRMGVECLFDIGRSSYFGQFGEDAFLQTYFEAKSWRQQRPPPFSRPKLKKGFYVDVGAFAPKQYSNTYLFYTKGWCGINIDATPGSMRAFDLIRRRDVNIEAALSCLDEELVFYCWGVPSVVNTLSRERAKRWTKILGREPAEVRVATTRLETILSQHLPRDQSISFLSVDVEGHDLEVLRSNNWEKYRPELVLVESHEDTFEQVLNSEITRFLKTVRYDLYSWIRPSVVYRNEDLPSPEDMSSRHQPGLGR
jgi:FkbM family methyltransferase